MCVRSIAYLYFLFARGNYGSKVSMGQDTPDCYALELGRRASNTRFIESPLGIIKKNLNKLCHKLVWFVLWRRTELFYHVMFF